MQSSSRAPVLSATFRRVSCWIPSRYLAFCPISARRQFFVFESGRDSTIRTTSPTPAVFCSSCAWNLRVRRTTFLYFGCSLVTSTWTTIVFSPLSETTTPRRSWRAAGVVSGFAVRVIRLRLAGFSRAGFECLWRSDRGSRFFDRFGASGSATACCSSAGAAAGGSAPGAAAVVSSTSGVSSDSATAGSSAGAAAVVSSTSGVSSAFGVSSPSGLSSASGIASVSSFFCSSAICSLFTDGQDSCDLAPLQLQLRRILELPRRRLEPQVEELLPGVGETAVELVIRQVAQVLSQQRDHYLRGARTSS